MRCTLKYHDGVSHAELKSLKSIEWGAAFKECPFVDYWCEQGGAEGERVMPNSHEFQDPYFVCVSWRIALVRPRHSCVFKSTTSDPLMVGKRSITGETTDLSYEMVN